MAEEIRTLEVSLSEADGRASAAEARLAAKDQKLKDAVSDFRRIKEDMISRMKEKDRLLAEAREQADALEAELRELKAASGMAGGVPCQNIPPDRSEWHQLQQQQKQQGWGWIAASPRRSTAGRPSKIGLLLPGAAAADRLAKGAIAAALAELWAEQGENSSGGGNGNGIGSTHASSAVGQDGSVLGSAGVAGSDGTAAAAWAELARAKAAHQESLRVARAMHDEAQRFNRNLWSENAKLIAKAEALQRQLIGLVAQTASAAATPAALSPLLQGEQGGEAVARSQQQVQELQQLLLERNALITQLSEELVEVSNDVQRFEETVMRCEAVTAQLKAQRMDAGRAAA
uniref:Uncharacterized protein n=2 Tax=Chlamydomonas euryale TaxID=1486919 RepID=A0A7R9V1E4_9CHLO|mmetsp:Transcript_10103/g.30457  ORF Transcript_10103/g.30457 Transcript_10103/m.30457 type:complete len:345 (+) Transcript_10103:3-1037(+)